jgi:hypothetical protein
MEGDTGLEAPELGAIGGVEPRVALEDQAKASAMSPPEGCAWAAAGSGASNGRIDSHSRHRRGQRPAHGAT